MKQWKSLSELGSIYGYLFLMFMVYSFGNSRLFLMLLSSLVLSYIIAVTIRVIYFKDRPSKEKYNNILEKIDASSFPSIHAMRSSIVFALFTLYFNDVFLAVMFFITSLMISISRYKIKKHYWLDIIIGYLIGLIIACLSYLIFYSDSVIFMA